LLSRSGFEGQLADGLRDAIDGAVRAPERRSPLAIVATWAWRTYDDLLDWRWFHRAIWLVFVLRAVAGIVTAAVVVWGALHADMPPLHEQLALGTSCVSLAMTLIGMARLPRSRLQAYRWFERAILISVFLTQVILFWQDQLAALTGLAWDLALLTVLRFLIRQEEAREALKLGAPKRTPALNL
jgi:hypothetical protein